MNVVSRFMRSRIMVSVWLLCFAGLAQAQVWQGTLGRSSIVVKLDSAADQLNGEYFYRRHRLGITLSGTRAANGSLTLEEWTMGDDGPPVWRFSAGKGDTLTGEWISDGKRLPIRLRRTSAATLPKTDDPALAELRAKDAYRFLQLQGMPLEAGKLQTIGAYRLQWWREPKSDIELFRVISGYPQAQLPAINLALARRQWQEVQSYLDCRSSPLSDYRTTTTLRYIGKNALSVSLYADFYCGGAQPELGDAPINLDPRTGRELTLEDVLWLGKGAPPLYGDSDNQAWFDYRSDVLGPWLAEKMRRRYPGKFAGTTDEYCSYEMEGVWNFPAWYVTGKGIYLGVHFPREMRACDNPEWSILPWSVVDKHRGAVRIRP
jgi:hypothetical protein